MARCGHRLKTIKNKYDIPTFKRLYYEQYYKWAGHVERLPRDRLTYKVHTYRDSSYLRFLEQVHGQQTHSRKLRIWRWEHHIDKFYSQYGLNWKEEAANRRNWAFQMPDFVAWAEQRNVGF